MEFFSKLFGRSKKSTTSDHVPKHPELTPCKTVQELLERFGGIALERQLNFGEIIGTNAWNVDIIKEEISFGGSLTFPMQVLGTISHASETWLWAWANTKSGLSESITQQSLQLKKYGEEHGIDLLRNSTFDFSKDDLQLIGMIASGMSNSSAYYIADYGQGAMVVTVKNDKVDKSFNDNPLSQVRILTVFPQLISQFEMNHKFALTNYLKAKNYSIHEQGNTLTGSKGTNRITAEFDDSFRLTKLELV